MGHRVGLFATSSIAANVLLGEYACDRLMGKDLVLCKKTDAV